MKRFATKTDDGWIEMIPAEFMRRRNMSIPPARLEAEGLLEMPVDPDPDDPNLIVEDGEIEERNGRPHMTRRGVEPSAAALQTMKRKKRDEINAAFAEGVRVIARAYPVEERLGWVDQVAGADRVKGGKPDGLLQKISELTGESPQMIANSIKAAQADYTEAYARAVAAKRVMTARVDNAAGIANFKNIKADEVFRNFSRGGRGEGLL